MTYLEFLDVLRKTPRKWKFFGNSLIRLVDSGHFCPITAVCCDLKSTMINVHSWSLAAKKIKLPLDVAKKISVAADSRCSLLNREEVKEIRKDLLKATGLKEAQ